MNLIDKALEENNIVCGSSKTEDELSDIESTGLVSAHAYTVKDLI